MSAPSAFMQLALAAAATARGRTISNPWVGAVVVRGGEVIAQGATSPPGGDHAEAAALRNVDARGADLYVTLEPCAPFEGKRTPSCAQAVIGAGVRRVFVAMADPHPEVAGKGMALLRAAGVEVELGDGFEAAVQLQRPFLKHAQTRLPYVIAKFAASLDGRTATARGESQWITGEAARDHAHRQRDWVDAVLAGSGTVLADDPSLAARPGGVMSSRQPVRVVVDARGRVPAGARVFEAQGQVIVGTGPEAPGTWKKAIAATGAQVIECEPNARGINLSQFLGALGERNIMSMWAEGGGTLLASLIEGGHADEVWAYLAPMVIGGDGLAAVGATGTKTLLDALRLSDVSVEELAPDVLIRGNTGVWSPKLAQP
ncbi:MAG: bifunctional diaminohydroxyphosphoribosylaminopyrimidine deaminase/5-amino-6-(5-phosphoribosylamino)uracil reductase RibD [Anaerolinea sp.]|nr:bifunctional diaminohydroxyphosphoribosylaminopyrimidine deaminase/5-amino-6-(5-phosphoribosylamino)uracil reductase RibD [Anaerolinea sp.]